MSSLEAKSHNRFLSIFLFIEIYIGRWKKQNNALFEIVLVFFLQCIFLGFRYC